MGKCRISRRVLLIAAVVIAVVVISVYFAVFLRNEDAGAGPIITLPMGKLQGEWVEAVQGRGFKYAAFRGIRYAQPPVGSLRFKAPRPVTKWDGVYDATTEGNICVQFGTGSEDCLFLNVYTPMIPSNETLLLPVYFFIHGGAFVYGSGGVKQCGGPDFLVQQNIVVVTTNYRLGALGFIGLDTEDIPGNAGLKDQLAALRWVNKHIESFGGDPSKVTLGGHSAGAVSASWLTLLKQTQDLIRSATIQSGSALHAWSLNVKNKEFAKEVAKVLLNQTDIDDASISQELISASVSDLFGAADIASKNLQETKTLGSDISNFYLPTLELRQQGGEEKLITRDPESYMILPERTDIPIIFGETRREWAAIFEGMDIAHNETKLDASIENLITRVPSSIMPGEKTQNLLGIAEYVSKLNVTETVMEIKEYFFYNEVIGCNNQCRMAKYLDHAFIMADTSHLVRLRAKYSNESTYAFVFSLKSDYNQKPEQQLPQFLQDAVIHGDDMSYMWSLYQYQDYYGNNTAAQALRRQIAMWTNFIKEGNPTPKIDDLITVKWEPVKKDSDEPYLDINERLSLRHDKMQGSSSQIWERIFYQYRNHTSP